MYSIPLEESGSGGWIENTFYSDKGYTYGIMYTTAIAVLALICTLFLENKFAVCIKGKKVNGKYNHEEEDVEDANETMTFIKLKSIIFQTRTKTCDNKI